MNDLSTFLEAATGMDADGWPIGSTTMPPDCAQTAETVTELRSLTALAPGSAVSNSVTSQLCNSSVSAVVGQCLPANGNQTASRLFKLARGVKMLEKQSGYAFTAADMEQIFQLWHEQSRPFLRFKQTEQQYMTEFLLAYDNARRPLDEDDLQTAWQRAQTEPLPPSANKFRSNEMRQLVALCWQLQLAQPDQPFHLSCRNAGHLIGVDHVQAARFLVRLVAEQILTITKKGEQKTGKATRYRFNSNPGL